MSTTSYIGRKVKLTEDYVRINPEYVHGGKNEGIVTDDGKGNIQSGCWVVLMSNGTEAIPFVPNHYDPQCMLLDETPESVAGHTILDTAKELIYGDREKDYGKTSDNFKDIAKGWEVITKATITPEQVGLMMAWLKICRANKDNCEKQDSLVDLAGYAGCIEKIKKGL
jgi:hypothetical protein